MSEFKIKNCKKLTLRKDLCNESAVLYLSKKDRFYVDTSKVYYDFQNTPMYKAKLYYGKEGYVAKEGVEEIVKLNDGRKHLAYNKKVQSGKRG